MLLVQTVRLLPFVMCGHIFSPPPLHMEINSLLLAHTVTFCVWSSACSVDANCCVSMSCRLLRTVAAVTSMFYPQCSEFWLYVIVPILLSGRILMTGDGGDSAGPLLPCAVLGREGLLTLLHLAGDASTLVRKVAVQLICGLFTRFPTNATFQRLWLDAVLPTVG
jgi:hypothetical protein